MGNEMGNINTSGILHENDDTTAEGVAKSLQEPVHANHVQRDDHIVHLSENNHIDKKESELSSNDSNASGKNHTPSQIPDDTEQKKTEVQPPSESPKTETRSDDAGHQESEMTTAPSFKELEDPDKPTDAILEENHLGENHSEQHEKQTSFEKEEDEMLNSSSVTKSQLQNQEPQDLVKSISDQPEVKNFDAHQSEQDSSNSQGESNDILGLSIASATKENGHHEDTSLANSLDEAIVSGSNLIEELEKDDLPMREMVSQEDLAKCGEEKSEVMNNDENELSKLTTITSEIPSDGEINCNGELINSKASQPEDNNLMPNLPTSYVEVPLPEDKCMVLTEETKLVRKESENEENKQDQLTEETIRESEIDEAKVLQTDFENDEMGELISISYDRANSGDRQEEAKAAGEGSSNGVSEENCEEFLGKNVAVTEVGMLPADLSNASGRENEEEVGDCKLKEEEPEEKQIVDEIKEKPEVSTVPAKETESIEQFKSASLHIQPEPFPQSPPASLLQCQDFQQKIAMPSEDKQDSSSTLELQPKSSNEIIVSEPSTFHARSLTMECLASAIELEFEKPLQAAASETNHSSSGLPASEKYEVVETSVPARECYEALESLSRLCIELNPNNFNINAQRQKSPSFDIDLRTEDRCEESDQTPLLCQDKTTTIESLSSQAQVILQYPLLQVQYDQESLDQGQGLEAEEKVLTLERSDSEKSRTPFLGFTKQEEEEANGEKQHTPKKQGNKAAGAAKKASTEVVSKSGNKEVPSSKKHKRRSSLFTNCMCCTTVTN